MPTYNFRNTETGEITEEFMSISAREEYLKNNPHLESYIDSAPMLCDPVRIGVRKMDSGFKEVLQKIHEKTPKSQLKKSSSQL